MKPLTVRYQTRFGQSRAWSAANRKAAPAPDPAAEAPQGRPPAPTVPRVARLLALAHYVERAVLDGTCPDYATAAKALGMCHARMSQIIDLLGLAPDLQAALLDGSLAVTERRLRYVLTEPLWAAQRARLAAINGDSQPSVD